MGEKEINEIQTGTVARLQAIIEATPECIKIVAPDGSLQFMNKVGLAMVEAADMASVKGSSIFEVIAPGHRQAWSENHKRVCGGESLHWEFEIIGLKGTKRCMETHAVPLPNEDGTFSQLAVARDITKRKSTEEALRRNEIILTGQKRALELAVHGASLSDVLDVLTLTAERQGSRDLFASILLIDADGKRLLLGSAPHLPRSYNEAINGIEIGPGVGSCGTAAYTKREVIVTDIKTDPRWKNFKDLAVAHGLHACWSTPILSSNTKLLATFALYYAEVHAPSPEDRKAVELLSRTVGIVMEWYNDVQERNSFRTALRTTESHLSALVTATSDVVYKLSADWSVMGVLDGKNFLNDAYEPVVGWRDINVHRDHRKMVDEAIDNAIQTKSIFQLEHKVNRADGSAGWTFSRAIPILDNNGEILEWYGVASDITERKGFETALTESEAKFRRFYESNMLPVAFWNTEGKIHECNQAYASLVGYELDEITNGEHNWIHDTVSTHQRLHHENIKKAVEGQVFMEPYEVDLLRKDGSTISALIGFTMLEGSATKGVAFLMDVTARKSLMVALEQRVTERTKELNAVNKALKQSNGDLLQFAHVASHDLKEPLRKIKTFANRMYDEEKHCLSEKGEVYLGKVLSSASRMSTMVDGVLAYSSISGTEQVFGEVNLNEVVQNVKEDLEVLIADKNGTIDYGELPTIMGSEFLIYQLFYNVINNSLKFSKADIPPHIRISPDVRYDGNQRLTEIMIEDNGIGFDPKFAEQIFTPFIRLNSMDQYEGTGLGLALCKKIVERHNGKIYASGQKGQGAKFKITLPSKI